MSGSRARRALVTGAAGMLGREVLVRPPQGWTVVGTDRTSIRGPRPFDVTETDLVDPEGLSKLWSERGPFDAVIHCAAHTEVDLAETTERDAARLSNVIASEVVADACKLHGARLVAVSTDFVFDGASTRPYVESDDPNPLSVYGETKLAGERAVLSRLPGNSAIVRTQWLYGPGGRHFPRTIARIARERHELAVVNDQTGSPTTTLELAPALWDVLTSGGNGIFHAACEGSCTWYEFAVAILEELGIRDVRLKPCTTADFPRPARRPAYSVLDSSRLARLRGRRLAHWRDALKAYLGVETP